MIVKFFKADVLNAHFFQGIGEISSFPIFDELFVTSLGDYFTEFGKYVGLDKDDVLEGLGSIEIDDREYYSKNVKDLNSEEWKVIALSNHTDADKVMRYVE